MADKYNHPHPLLVDVGHTIHVPPTGESARAPAQLISTGEKEKSKPTKKDKDDKTRNKVVDNKTGKIPVVAAKSPSLTK
jgi:hypothetical protein